MFALHITEPGRHGFPEVRQVVLVDTRSKRDRLVAWVNEQQRKWAEYRKRNPYETVPSSFCWSPGTSAKPITMTEARKLIGNHDPNLISDGWCRAYNYTPCKVWECRVYKCYENDPLVYGYVA